MEELDIDVGDANLEDPIQLSSGDVHPPEYYRRAVQELNESAFDKQNIV